MQHNLSLFRAYMHMEMTVKAQYRANMLLGLIGLLVEPMVYLIVWLNVANAQGGEIGGYVPRPLAVVVFAAELLGVLGDAAAALFLELLQEGAHGRLAEHAVVQGRGRAAYYETYTLFACDNPRIHHFSREEQA